MISALERRVPEAWRLLFRKAYNLPWMALYAAAGRRRIQPPPDAERAIGAGDFTAIGEAFLGYAIDLAGLRPHHRVLDVGCGLGRMAIPLTRYLRGQGSYEGFDVEGNRVAWCQRNITRRYPRFHFQRVDVGNKAYNPAGRQAASAFSFPYPDAAFDLVLLASVFTHMLEGDMRRYLAEIARVLRPGGRCLATYFLLNDESERLLAEGHGTLRFLVRGDGCRYVDERVPEGAIAWQETLVRRLHEESGLRLLEPVRYGSWPGRDRFFSYQDIAIAERPAVDSAAPPAPLPEERIHPERTGNRTTVELHLARYRWAGRFVRDADVLDLACGTGYGSRLLRRKGGARSVLGADRSPEAIETARGEFADDGVSFQTVPDAAGFAPERPFDAVVSLETVEHLSDPLLYLRKAHAWLRQGGILVASVPTDEKPGENPYHLHRFTRATFEMAFSEGFEPLDRFEQASAYRTLAGRRRNRPAAAWRWNGAARVHVVLSATARDFDPLVALVARLRESVEEPLTLEVRTEESDHRLEAFLNLLGPSLTPMSASPAPRVALLCAAHARLADGAWLARALAHLEGQPTALVASGEGASVDPACPPRDLACRSGGCLIVPREAFAGPWESLAARLSRLPIVSLPGVRTGSSWNGAEAPGFYHFP